MILSYALSHLFSNFSLSRLPIIYPHNKPQLSSKKTYEAKQAKRPDCSDLFKFRSKKIKE